MAAPTRARRLINQLQTLDRWLLVAANGHRTPWLDSLMVFFSERLVWFPAYAVVLVALGYLLGRRAWLMVALLAACVALADVISSRLFKPYFARLRPCHDPNLSDALNLIHGCGGQYGFMSSHAANAFAFAVFVALGLPARYRAGKALLLAWAAVVSYSRVYLAAHFPSDVVAGAVLGSALAWLGALAYARLAPRWWPATASA